MLSKSANYMDVGVHLLNNGKYTAAVHFFYYSVFQYMKYLLNSTTNNPIEYSKQDKTDGSSHQYILDEIDNRMTRTRDTRNLYQDIMYLKRERVAADYTPRTFSQDECAGIRAKSESVKSRLKSYYKNLL